MKHRGSGQRIWWWAYFALSILVFVASVATSSHWSLRTLLLSVFFGIGLLGLWGYLRAVAIWRRAFWVGYFCVMVAGAAYSIVSTVLEATHSDTVFLISLLLVAVAFAVPTWVALWRYAFGSGIWGSFTDAA